MTFIVSMAQKEKEYKYLNGYNGNVLYYLYENFYLAKENYIGKPLKDLLNKLEVPITYSLPTLSYSSGYDLEYPGCKRIIFFFNDNYDTKKEIEDKIQLGIHFTSITSTDSIRILNRKGKTLGEWTKEKETFYGKLIVSDISFGRNEVRFYDYLMPLIANIYYLAEQNKLFRTAGFNYFKNNSLAFTLAINWPDSLNKFIVRYPENTIVNSEVYKDYQYAVSLFKSTNFSASDAYQKNIIGYMTFENIQDPELQAFAYVLHKYHTGVYIIKMDANNKKNHNVYDNHRVYP